MLRAILNKCCKQHSIKQQLCGHISPISQTIEVRRIRHAELSSRSKNELISDVFPWTTSHRRASIEKLIYISFVRTQDVVWKTCREQWVIGMDRKRESRKYKLLE